MDIRLDEEVGKGNFGAVYKGSLLRFAEYDTLDNDTPMQVRGRIPVAVKMLKSESHVLLWT